MVSTTMLGEGQRKVRRGLCEKNALTPWTALQIGVMEAVEGEM